MQWLCDCYLPSLWRFVYTRVGGDAHLAEDITSETVLAMLNSLQSAPCDQEGHTAPVEIENLAGWLRTVAQRRISDHFRAVSRVQHLVERCGGGAERSEVDPAAQQELEESRAAVRHAMDELPEQHRLALEWKYLDNLSVREIAQRWEITEKAAESILFRARRELREGLEKPCHPVPTRNGRPAREKELPQGEASHEDLPSNPSHEEPRGEKTAHGISRE
jgi:RNA polymerase sigma factor (sigma-70 family)